MIAMRKSDRPREAIRNRTSLSDSAWTIDSISMQPTNCLKGQPAQRLLDNLPFGGTLKV